MSAVSLSCILQRSVFMGCRTDWIEWMGITYISIIIKHGPIYFNKKMTIIWLPMSFSCSVIREGSCEFWREVLFVLSSEEAGRTSQSLSAVIYKMLHKNNWVPSGDAARSWIVSILRGPRDSCRSALCYNSCLGGLKAA